MGIRGVPPGLDRNLDGFLRELRSAISNLDGKITTVVKTISGSSATSGPGTTNPSTPSTPATPAEDCSKIPSAPTSLTASAGSFSITLQWEQSADLICYQTTEIWAQRSFDSWNSSYTYSPGALVLVSGVVYRSKQVNNTNHAVTDTNWWAITTLSPIGKSKVGEASGSNWVHTGLNPGETWAYWVRNRNKKDLFSLWYPNNDTGVVTTTLLDPTAYLNLLTGAITQTQLYSDLGAKIDLIAPTNALATQANTLATSAGTLATAANNLANSLQAGTTDISVVTASGTSSLRGLKTTSEGHTTAIATLQTTTADQATSISTLQTTSGNNSSAISALQTTTAGQATQISGLQTTSGNNSSAISTLQTTTAGQATQISGLQTATTNNASAITAEASTRASADSALSSSITTLQTSVAGNTSAITAEASTRASADSALSTSLSTVQSTVSGHTTSIQSNTTSINGLLGQYTVRIDNNGWISGFGLASTTQTDGTVISDFGIRADRFWLAPPNTPVGAQGGPGVGLVDISGNASGTVIRLTSTVLVPNGPTIYFAYVQLSGSLSAYGINTYNFSSPPATPPQWISFANIRDSYSGTKSTFWNQAFPVFGAGTFSWTDYSFGPTSPRTLSTILPGVTDSSRVVLISSAIVYNTTSGYTTAVTDPTQTNSDPAKLIPPALLPFIVTTSAQTYNGATVAPGVYMNNAYIVNAMLGRATLTGVIGSNNYVSGASGWQIDSAGNAEFNTVIVRTGNVQANAITKMAGGQNNVVYWYPTMPAPYLGIGQTSTQTIYTDGGDLYVHVSATLKSLGSWGTGSTTAYGTFTLNVNGVDMHTISLSADPNRGAGCDWVSGSLVAYIPNVGTGNSTYYVAYNLTGNGSHQFAWCVLNGKR